MADQKVRIKLPKKLKPAERRELGKAIVDHITDRTLSGKDKNNRKFGKYTKEYAKEKGVSRSDVDLVLTAEMMTELRFLRDRSDSVTIGYEGDEALNGKVEGNRKGTYGQKQKVAPKRDFLGIPKKDLKELIKKVVDARSNKG